MSAAVEIGCQTCGERVAFQQGCCNRCIFRHRSEVRKGRTSWTELEERGLARRPLGRKAKEILEPPRVRRVQECLAGREIRCLSVMQPWAMLLALGVKEYETRGWMTLYRGELAIHVSRSFPVEARWLCRQEPFRSALRLGGYFSEFDLPTGVIIGLARLVGCVACEDLRTVRAEERAFGDFRRGRWAYRFEEPRLLAEPVPARGKVGIFKTLIPSESEYPKDERQTKPLTPDPSPSRGEGR